MAEIKHANNTIPNSASSDASSIPNEFSIQTILSDDSILNRESNPLTPQDNRIIKNNVEIKLKQPDKVKSRKAVKSDSINSIDDPLGEIQNPLELADNSFKNSLLPMNQNIFETQSVETEKLSELDLNIVEKIFNNNSNSVIFNHEEITILKDLLLCIVIRCIKISSESIWSIPWYL